MRWTIQTGVGGVADMSSSFPQLNSGRVDSAGVLGTLARPHPADPLPEDRAAPVLLPEFGPPVAVA